MAPLNAEPQVRAYQDDLEETNEFAQDSVIQDFFNDSNVFLTGGTGFMGQVLIEKLLRSCPGVKCVYMLIRPKKGKEVEQRYVELFAGPLFDRLKLERPKALQKVVLVLGDVAQPELGLSDVHKQTLLNDVSVVFHLAATVRFDEKLRTAVAINITGTKTLLTLARQMKKLKAMVHVSTAFSNCPIKNIDEVFYTPGVDGDKLEALTAALTDEQLEILLPSMLGKWPNTYTFTKSIAEDCIKRYGHGLPLAIVRPSIVVNTAKEPLIGWINNVYGAIGVAVGAAMGILKSLHCNKDNLAELVPVDMAIGCTLAVAWDIGNSRKKNLEKTDTTDVAPIYNYVSSAQRPMTWGEFMEYNEVGLDTPLSKAIWYYCFTLNRHRFVHNVYVLFLHLLPAIIADTISILMGKKPVLWNIYKKIHKFTDVIAYFSSQQWTFTDDNVKSLWRRLGAADRSVFNFNIADLDWRVMMGHSVRGMRAYIVNDPIENVPAAIRRYRKLKIAHYTIVTAVSSLLLFSVYKLISLFF